MIRHNYNSVDRIYKLYQLSSRQLKAYSNSAKNTNNINRLTR